MSQTSAFLAASHTPEGSQHDPQVRSHPAFAPKILPGSRLESQHRILSDHRNRRKLIAQVSPTASLTHAHTAFLRKSDLTILHKESDRSSHPRPCICNVQPLDRKVPTPKIGICTSSAWVSFLFLIVGSARSRQASCSPGR